MMHIGQILRTFKGDFDYLLFSLVYLASHGVRPTHPTPLSAMTTGRRRKRKSWVQGLAHARAVGEVPRDGFCFFESGYSLGMVFSHRRNMHIEMTG